MSKKLLCALLLITLPFSLPAKRSKPDEGEIVVQLATENRLLPLYLAKLQTEECPLEPQHVAELERTLRFDLENNGMTSLKEHSGRREGLIAKREFDEADSAEDWKKENTFYVVKTKITEKTLSARVVSLTAGTVKGIDNLKLTGDLKKDRRTIHELSNAIHQTLFDQPSITNTRFLYTIRYPNPNGKGPEWLSEVWEADYDGHNAHQVTHDGHYCVNPTYLPPTPGYASHNFFYVSYRTGQPKIFVSATDGSARNRLSYLRGNQLMPAISRQRDQVAFISDVTGNPDLFLIPFSPESGATGKPYQIFSAMRGTQASPTFSPDGSQVAFVSNKDGSPRIYIMDVPSPGAPLRDIQARLITKINRENTSPAWSPDGTKVAYSSKTEGTRQIWVYDRNTGEERQLTKGAGHKENPTWAPNSLHLIFNSADDDSSELYLVNLNQPKAVKISSGPGEKRFPAWEPPPDVR